MVDFIDIARTINNPEKLANVYLQHYFKEQSISYPLNPFQMLLDEGVNFAIRNFGKLEGVYIPAENNTDLAIAGINLSRPITRQRFTAAHELCHHFRDSNQQLCPISSKKTIIERYADDFAAALLMPVTELSLQVNKRLKPDSNYIEFEDVLDVANYFGVSFESCLFRIAYRIHAISGNTAPRELRKRIRKYKPNECRKKGRYNNLNLYEQLMDSYSHALRLKPNNFMRNVFQTNYIYNDSRMEDVDISVETAAEIVTDIRLNQQSSKYCSEANETFLSIAGHAVMYMEILATPTPDNKFSIFDIIKLNRKLFSCFPYPESGGQIRQTNTLVLGAKFETTDYHDIIPELTKLDNEAKEFYKNLAEQTISSYIEFVIQLHHKLTVIHPFSDGNGRTLRAFLNMLLVRNNLTPVYIKVEDKDNYLKALAIADLQEDYAPLYAFFFKAILRSNVELTR